MKIYDIMGGGGVKRESRCVAGVTMGGRRSKRGDVL